MLIEPVSQQLIDDARGQAGRMDEARRQLVRLAEMNHQGRTREWEFNEWFHGVSGRPMGDAGQSWSAALYILAHDAVTQGQVKVFNHANGWGIGPAA